MRYLLFILFFLSGFTDGNFNSAWGGEIQGQVFRVISDGVVVVEDFDGVAVEDADDWCQKFRCEGRRAQADETKEDQDHQIHIALQYLPWPMSAYPLYASRRELNTIADIL